MCPFEITFHTGNVRVATTNHIIRNLKFAGSVLPNSCCHVSPIQCRKYSTFCEKQASEFFISTSTKTQHFFQGRRSVVEFLPLHPIGVGQPHAEYVLQRRFLNSFRKSNPALIH